MRVKYLNLALVMTLGLLVGVDVVAREPALVKNQEVLAPEFIEFLEMLDTQDDLWPVLVEAKSVVQLDEEHLKNGDQKKTPVREKSQEKK